MVWAALSPWPSRTPASTRSSDIIATTLQENLLHPLEVAGLEVATTSAASSDVELIGGDFSDVFMLADGRALIVHRRCAGKGIRAAGLTETVRSTMRAFATIDAAPGVHPAQDQRAAAVAERPDAPSLTALLYSCILEPTGHINLGSAGRRRCTSLLSRAELPGDTLRSAARGVPRRLSAGPLDARSG